MKKLVFAVVALLSFTSLATEASLGVIRSEPCGFAQVWTPVRLSLAGPAALPWGNWDVKGLDIGLWNDSSEMDGLEIGIVNTTYRMRGLQIGLVNVTRNACGVQIGLVNVIRSNTYPFVPVINCYF